MRPDPSISGSVPPAAAERRIRPAPPRLAPGLLVLVASALLAPAPAGAQHAPAILVQYRGPVQVVREATGDTLPPRVGLRLQVEDLLEVPGGGRAVLLFGNGRMLTVTSTLRVREEGAAGDPALQRTAGALGSAGSGGAPRRPGGEGGGRPMSGAAHPLSPAHDVAVLDVRPTFTWVGREGAEGYVIQIRGETGSVRRFDTGPDTSWTLPADAPPLAPGGSYSWTVADRGGGRVTGQRSFRVADGETFARVGSFLAGLQEQGIDPWSDGLLLTAAFYHDQGLEMEAAAALERLVASDVEVGPVVRLLQAEVYEALGRWDEASRAFREAGSGP